MGFKVKLLGVAVATAEGIEQRVHPTLVPKGSPVADTDGVFNAVVVQRRFRRRSDAGRARRRRASDRLCRAFRYRRHRARQSAAVFRPAGERPAQIQSARRSARMRAAIMWRSSSMTSPVRSRPSPGSSRTRKFRSRASCSALPAKEGAIASFMLVTHKTLEFSHASGPGADRTGRPCRGQAAHDPHRTALAFRRTTDAQSHAHHRDCPRHRSRGDRGGAMAGQRR